MYRSSTPAHFLKLFAKNHLNIDVLHYLSNEARVVTMGNRMSINLLPWRDMENKKRTEKLFYFLIIYSLVACMTMITLKNIFSHEGHILKTKTILIRNNTQRIIIDRPQQHAALLQQLTLLATKKTASLKTNHQIISLLSSIANDMPASITLNTLALDNNKKIMLTGVGDQLANIHQYYLALQQNMLWKHILLTEMHTDQKNKSQMDFTIQVTP